MKRPEVQERFVNRDAELPYGLEVSQVVSAVESFYEYWHEVNEWHLEQGYGRFHEQFRANNAIGGFVSHRLTIRFAEESPDFVLNRLDDGYPDLLYDGTDYEWPETYDVKDPDGPGLEVKSSRGTTFYAHHNMEGWLLGIFYRINARGEADTDEAPAPDDTPPIEVTQVLCASMDQEDWEYRDAEGSNRTNTSELEAGTGLHEMRKNPIIEMDDAITGQGDLLQEYKQAHEEFDPLYSV
ncbi:hypothetical protein EXE43_05675 [Halorubrum sp. SS5]|nr:hypothetical protein EXE43_05675 [Halorubrum sp. SS5]